MIDLGKKFQSLLLNEQIYGRTVKCRSGERDGQVWGGILHLQCLVVQGYQGVPRLCQMPVYNSCNTIFSNHKFSTRSACTGNHI